MKRVVIIITIIFILIAAISIYFVLSSKDSSFDCTKVYNCKKDDNKTSTCYYNDEIHVCNNTDLKDNQYKEEDNTPDQIDPVDLNQDILDYLDIIEQAFNGNNYLDEITKTTNVNDLSTKYKLLSTIVYISLKTNIEEEKAACEQFKILTNVNDEYVLYNNNQIRTCAIDDLNNGLTYKKEDIEEYENKLYNFYQDISVDPYYYDATTTRYIHLYGGDKENIMTKKGTYTINNISDDSNTVSLDITFNETNTTVVFINNKFNSITIK